MVGLHLLGSCFRFAKTASLLDMRTLSFELSLSNLFRCHFLEDVAQLCMNCLMVNVQEFTTINFK